MEWIEVTGSGFGPGTNARAGTRPTIGIRPLIKPGLSRIIGPWLALAGLVWSSTPNAVWGATRSLKERMVPNWGRFEQVLISSIEYTNPLQQTTLTAVFTSPLGDRRIVNGFWDGRRTWRVRFCPDMAGEWTFTTVCSDARNSGLDGHTGEFLCTAPVGGSAFRRHGPIRVARDRRHFEHADGTPFFWLADTAGEGAFRCSLKDWERYANIRASQLFDVAIWSAAAQEDLDDESALTGLPDCIGINPSVFQRLDQKLETLSQEGILSAIVPFSDQAFGVSIKSLPVQQAALLANYMVARWGTEPVAWVADLQTDNSLDQIDRWKKVCSAVFTNSVHAPVVVLSAQSSRPENQFRDEPWVDSFGIQAAAGSGPEAAGSKLQDSNHGPSYPIILLAPRENGIAEESHKRFKPDDVRHAIYERLFMSPIAGVTYSAQGVVDWNMNSEPANSPDPDVALPVWEKALFLPGAKQMRFLAKLMNSVDFWRLRPRPDAVPNEPGQSSTGERAVAASTSARDLTLVYLPQANPVNVSLEAMPDSPRINWIEPRQGFTQSAVAVVSGATCQFPPPGAGDWVLLIKSGK